jgi:hypothetical protein
MKLVKIENYQVVVEDELLLLKPFRKLYNADRTVGKSKFMDFMTILYYVYDPRSDYSYIADEEGRLKEVCDSNGIKTTSFGKEERECIELYKKLTTTTSLELLSSAKIAINKVRTFLEEIDLTKTDDKEKPIYTINSVVSAIKIIPQLAKDVMEAERTVAKELEEKSRTRGSLDRKLFEDGINIEV